MRKVLTLIFAVSIIVISGGSTIAQCPESISFDSLKTSFYGGVAYAGDVNNDGYDDFLVGSTDAVGNKGAVYIHSGRTGLILYALENGDYSYGTGLDRKSVV